MSMRAERKTLGKLLTNYSNNFSNSYTEYSLVFYHSPVSEPEPLLRLEVAGWYPSFG
jgi:hypothetical protein